MSQKRYVNKNNKIADAEAVFLAQRQFERDLNGMSELVLQKYDENEESWEYWLNRTDKLPEQISVVLP